MLGRQYIPVEANILTVLENGAQDQVTMEMGDIVNNWDIFPTNKRQQPYEFQLVQTLRPHDQGHSISMVENPSSLNGEN